MKKISVFLAGLILLVACLAGPGFCSSPFRAALRVKDWKVVDLGVMFADLKAVDLIYIGEDHNDPSHHQLQLQIIASLHEAGVPLAVGLEMFRAEDQRQLDLWTSGRLDLEAFISLYYASWRLPWPLYRDILLYAREHEIPLIGLNIPGAISKKISKEGFASLSPSERRQLPTGISCSVGPRYMDFIRRAYGSHKGNGKAFVNFCEAQMVWDKAMAWRVVAYRKKHPSMKVVVLTGNGHAWKPGVPAQVQEVAVYSSRVLLPALPNLKIDKKAAVAAADYILLRDK